MSLSKHLTRLFTSECSERFSIAIPRGRHLIYRPPVADSYNSFEGLGMAADVIQSLRERHILLPTPIQILSIPAIKTHRRVVIGGETGSGKTLAFLYPTMHEIKLGESRSADFDSTRPKHPKGIILVPTNDLALQIKQEAKLLSKVIKLRAQALFFNMDAEYFKNVLQSRNDILILTPSRLLALIHEKKLFISDLSHLIIDEGDSMLDNGSHFGKDTVEIIRQVFSRTSTLPQPKLIISCATLTERLQKQLDVIDEMVPEAQFHYVISPGLHKPPRSCRQEFIRITQMGNEKHRRIVSILKGITNKTRVLIFTDRIDSMDLMRKIFEQNQILHYSWEKGEGEGKGEGNGELRVPANRMYDCIHGYLSVQKRKQLIDDFNKGRFACLVASGLTARGLDFEGGVDHVILYDLPKNPVDYLHRIGRSARAFSAGKVTVFVTRGTVRVAERIQQFMKGNLRITGTLY